MKNTSNVIRSRAARFVSLRVALVLCAVMAFAGLGVAPAWNGGFEWLSMRRASAQSRAASAAEAAGQTGIKLNAQRPKTIAELTAATGQGELSSRTSVSKTTSAISRTRSGAEPSRPSLRAMHGGHRLPHHSSSGSSVYPFDFESFLTQELTC